MKKIYTCGKMSGISYVEQMAWRLKIESEIKSALNFTDERVKFVHPPYYYNYEEKYHKTEREILEWEMAQVHDCDIVIVNLDGIEDTIGSHMELGAVQGINRFGDKHIFVIGLGKDDGLHPWIKESCIRIEDDYAKAAEYIVEYLLT